MVKGSAKINSHLHKCTPDIKHDANISLSVNYLGKLKK